MKTAIIFLPEAGIFQYLRSLCMVGDALKHEGYNVKLIECNGSVVRCPMLPCLGIKQWNSPEEKARTCEQCRKNAGDAAKYYGFDVINLRNYVNKTSLRNTDETAIQDLAHFEYRGLKVGQIAIHDLMLECKVLSVNNLSPEQERIYREHVQNMILLIDATDRIIKDYKPSVMLEYNPYAQCQAVLHACNMNNIKFCGITNTHHLGANWSLLQFTNHTFMTEYIEHCLNYDEGKDIPIPSSKVDAYFDDALFRMYGSGSHIFSSSKHQDPKALLDKLKLSENKKTIGAFTSSLDERIGIKTFFNAWDKEWSAHEVFQDQLEWLKFLQDFAHSRDDVQIVVRIHPREGRNGESEHLIAIKEEFLGKVFPNFQIIWPNDDISSYDLFELIDCCLISSSTVGIECQRLGIPTLSYTTGISYPASGVIEMATSVVEYEQKLNDIVNHKCTLQELISSCRFYNWRIFVNSLDLGQSLPKEYFDTLTFTKVEENKRQLITGIVEGNIDLIRYNLSELIGANNSKQEEIDAIKRGIRRVIDKLYFPNGLEIKSGKLKQLFTKIFAAKKNKFIWKDLFEDYELCYSENVTDLKEYIVRSRRCRSKRFVVKDAGFAVLVMDGQVYRRFSKVVIALARIHEELI